MNREERIKYAAECLDEQEANRFFLIYNGLKNPLEWSVFYDFDEKWVKLEKFDMLDDLLPITLYFGSERG